MALESLARAAFRPRSDPPLEGWVHPAFSNVAVTLGKLLASYGGGAAVCVYHRGEVVVDIWGGVRDRAGTPWVRETMAPSFSTTKGVASTLLHVLANRGSLDYDDRVADYWPEFAQAGKERITIRQVLAHQSGLYHIRQMIDHADRMLDWKHMIEAIERARPIHPPGRRTGYHGLTFGFIVGEIAQRVTGQPFSALVRREIAEPLGLDGMYIGAPPDVLPRAAELLWPERGITRFLEPADKNTGRLASLISHAAGRLSPLARMVGIDIDLESILDALAPRGITSFDFGSAEALRAAIPSGNGLFTARSLARMYAVLAGGGEIDGVRLLSERIVRRASASQNFQGPRAVLPFDMRWRLGYHGVATSRGIPRRAFGHFGFGGSGAWAEPNRRLAVALIVNSGMGTPFGDTRILRIGGAALASADAHCPRPVAPARGRSATRTKKTGRTRGQGTSQQRRPPEEIPGRAALRSGEVRDPAGQRH